MWRREVCDSSRSHPGAPTPALLTQHVQTDAHGRIGTFGSSQAMTVPSSTQRTFSPCPEPFQAFKQIPHFAAEQNPQSPKQSLFPSRVTGHQGDTCQRASTCPKATARAGLLSNWCHASWCYHTWMQISKIIQ